MTAAVLLAVCLFLPLLLWADEGERALSQAARVGAWEAACESQGLDLRDSFNRPISRAALAKGLDSASKIAVRQAAGLSRMRGLAALLDYQERLGLGAGLRGGRGGRSPRSVSATASGQSKPAAGQASAAVPADTSSSSLKLSSLQLVYTPGRILLLPLRC